MDATQFNTEITPCGGPLPELETPMINALVACLASEHRRLDEHILSLALAANRLANDGDALTAGQAAFGIWDEIRAYLYSHLQIEDSLVFSWGVDHQAISATLRETLKIERQRMGSLVATAVPPLADRQVASTIEDPRALAQTLLALSQMLDQHIARYEGEVLPSIQRALFHREKAASGA
jgi:iron-sulfur cluster repair protein YtfE (RIC family)